MLRLETPGKMYIGVNGFIISVVNRHGLLTADSHDVRIWVDDEDRTDVPIDGIDNELGGITTEQLLDVIELVRSWDGIQVTPGVGVQNDLPVLAAEIAQLINT